MASQAGFGVKKITLLNLTGEIIGFSQPGNTGCLGGSFGLFLL